MKLYEMWSMVESESGTMEAAGLAVFADGQALVLAERRNPHTLRVDYEYSDYEDASERLIPQVMSLKPTADAVRSFTELYELAANKYGWDPDAERFWNEQPAYSIMAQERGHKPIRKPKGFMRYVEGEKDD